MHIHVIKIIAYSLIPKLVHDVYVAGKKLYKESYIFTPPSKKKRDTSPWTKKRFDIVIAKRKTWLEYNANPVHGKIAFITLINDINYTLNMRK